MKNLKFLIATGLLTISFNVPATGISYGDTDPDTSHVSVSDLTEIFRNDLNDVTNTDDHLMAYNFGSEIPEYFAIGGNIDNKHNGADLYVLFENVDNLSWGVFETSFWNNHESHESHNAMFAQSSESNGSGGHEYDHEEHHAYQFDPEHIIGYNTSAVPIPAAVWLFGSGLIGLVAVARRKK